MGAVPPYLSQQLLQCWHLPVEASGYTVTHREPELPWPEYDWMVPIQTASVSRHGGVADVWVYLFDPEDKDFPLRVFEATGRTALAEGISCHIKRILVASGMSIGSFLPRTFGTMNLTSEMGCDAVQSALTSSGLPFRAHTFNPDAIPNDVKDDQGSTVINGMHIPPRITELMPDYVGFIGEPGAGIEVFSGTAINPDTRELRGYVFLRTCPSRPFQRELKKLVIAADQCVAPYAVKTPIKTFASDADARKRR